MSSIRKLAGQTIYYGLSNIVSKLLNYFLTPYYLGIFGPSTYAEINTVYAIIPFANVIFTYGMETAFFRFAQQEDPRKVLNTSFISVFISTLLFSLLLWGGQGHLAQTTLGNIAGFDKHPAYFTWFLLIMAFDTLNAIPFVLLRLENRPLKYAMVRVGNILINIGCNVFFLSVCPYLQSHGQQWVRLVYQPGMGVGYVFLSNVIASGATLILLSKEIAKVQWHFDKALWIRMLRYAWPLIIVGLAGMVNETLDRAYFLPEYLPDVPQKKAWIGIYGANYKLSILITMFIQAFRLGAEPFFFHQSTQANAPQTYARVMKFFVMVMCVMFLFVALFLNIWKVFLRQEVYYEGLKIVPVLLLANLFLGIYYNLTVWFKLTDKTRLGALITITTAVLAFVFNYWWIPLYGYYGAALATMVCYGIQMIICYVMGQRYYPIPYQWKRLLAYMIVAVMVFFVYWFVDKHLISPQAPYAFHVSSFLLAIVLLLLYLLGLYKMEQKEWAGLVRQIGARFKH